MPDRHVYKINIIANFDWKKKRSSILNKITDLV